MFLKMTLKAVLQPPCVLVRSHIQTQTHTATSHIYIPSILKVWFFLFKSNQDTVVGHCDTFNLPIRRSRQAGFCEFKAILF